MKEITLAKLLEMPELDGRVVAVAKLEGAMFEAGAIYIINVEYKSELFGQGTTPDDALQDLCEEICGPDTLLDIGRSAKWVAAHGPDGVAGFCDGETGIVKCEGGKLVLVEKIPPDGSAVTIPFGHPTGVFATATELAHLLEIGRLCAADHPAAWITLDRISLKHGLDFMPIGVNPETGEFLSATPVEGGGSSG